MVANVREGGDCAVVLDYVAATVDVSGTRIVTIVPEGAFRSPLRCAPEMVPPGALSIRATGPASTTPSTDPMLWPLVRAPMVLYWRTLWTA
jgi:hypothetical protein